eukprot:GHRQ01030702.1.p1 GENE.GHRQ01030702.1~~GHRQ01030702.1.p1  ORF type:complete len:215 (+),score=24.17 GHRQ01030702.1:317-961(+)
MPCHWPAASAAHALHLHAFLPHHTVHGQLCLTCMTLRCIACDSMRLTVSRYFSKLSPSTSARSPKVDRILREKSKNRGKGRLQPRCRAAGWCEYAVHKRQQKLIRAPDREASGSIRHQHVPKQPYACRPHALTCGLMLRCTSLLPRLWMSSCMISSQNGSRSVSTLREMSPSTPTVDRQTCGSNRMSRNMLSATAQLDATGRRAERKQPAVWYI